MIALVIAVVAAGTVTVLHWAPVTTTGLVPPVASAHDTDMAPRGAPATDLGEAPPDAIQPTARGQMPNYLRIPDLGVESPVTRTSMDSEGTVAVPEDVTTTAWFDGSRRLGAVHGSVVIVGHRDSATQGTGALFGIEELPVGADITVTARDGTRYGYTVASVEFIDKTALPEQAHRIFTKRGPHRLVLITCGGAFDEEAGSYLSNIIVTALPATTVSD